MRKIKKGQSTLEYIILVAAVVAALIVFAGPSGILKTKIGDSLNQVSNGMLDMANRISGSRPKSP